MATQITKSLVILLVLLVSVSRLHAQGVPADWKTYSDTTFKVSVQYPPAWELQKKNTNDCLFTLNAPWQGNTGSYRGAVSMVGLRIKDGNTSLKKYAKACKDGAKQANGTSGYQQLNERYFTWNGLRAYEFVFIEQYNTSHLLVKKWMRVVVRNNMVYVLSYSTQADRKDALIPMPQW